MKQVLIGICDDEPYFVDELYKLVYACRNEYRLDFMIDTYVDIEELVLQIESKEKEYDMVFLDVEMPKMSGLDATKRLRENGYDGIICFVTSHGEYALDSYRLEGWGYLIKPAQYLEVKRLVKKAMIQISYHYNTQEAAKKYLEIKNRVESQKISMEKILYVEKRRNQCVIHLDDGEVVCYETLKNIWSRLNQSLFCYTHQGYIVNFNKIKAVSAEAVALGEGKEIPISRRYYKKLRERKINQIYEVKENMFAE